MALERAPSPDIQELHYWKSTMAHPSDRTHRETARPSRFTRTPLAGRFALLTLLSALAWPSPFALAQEPPGEAKIGAALEPELPAWWSVKKVEVRASVNEGDPVEPRWSQHFLADAAPGETLYVSGGETVGPFEVLIRTRAAAEAYRLYGVARSKLKLGDWVTEVGLENSVDGLGKPFSLFEGPALVAGSGKAERAAASLVVARELGRTVAEGIAEAIVDTSNLGRVAEEAAAALATASRERKDALRARYEEERAALAAAGERERAKVDQAHRSRLEALRAAMDEVTREIAATPAATEAESAALAARNRVRLDALETKYSEERAALAVAGERERAALAEQHRLRLQGLQADLAEEKAAIEAMPAATEAERAALVAEIRTRLDALQALHRRDLAEIATGGERERAALKEQARARLAEMKARLDEESAESEARVAAAQAERARLVEENRKALDALRTQGDAERAAVTATPETLLALSEAEAEVAGQRKLVPALRARLEEGKRVAAIAAEAAAADLVRRTRWYDALLEGLGSEILAKRQAAMELALASDDEGLRRMSLVLALVSDDREVRSGAVDTALVSGHGKLRAKAFDAALASDDREMKARAFDVALASDDREWKSSAIGLGLVSGDRKVRRKAFDVALDTNDKETKAKAVDTVIVSDDDELRSRAVEVALVPDNEWLVARLTRISQWASSVVEFSEESRSIYSNVGVAKAALGPPEVAPGRRCKSDLPSWSPVRDGGEHYITVSFARPVLFPDVVVHETSSHPEGAGFVRKIILRDTDGNGAEYSVRYGLHRCPAASEFDLRRHGAPVAEVTVVVDTYHLNGHWEGIDAIKLVGTPVGPAE